MEKVKVGVRVLFAILMINSGLNKFFQFSEMHKMTDGADALLGAFMASGYMFPLVGAVELIAGLFLLSKKYSALGGVLMMPITVNILALHCVLDPAGCLMGIVLMLINIWILWEERERLAGIIA